MGSKPRKFRFGVNPHGAADPAGWTAIATKAEDLGYSTLSVPDHLNPQLAPFAALTAAAAVTKTLRVGSLVLNNEFRHPAVTAKELATIDLLSGGRLDWGMGAGWVPEDFAAIGVERPPAVRVDRLIEAVEVMKAVFSGGPVHHLGPHYPLDMDAGTPQPVQRPHPPLLIGAAERRMLTFAGRVADIVSIAPGFAARAFGPYPAGMGVEENTDRQVGWVRSGAGDRFDDLELSVVAMPAQVTDRPHEVAEQVAPHLGLTPEQVLRSVHVLLGSVEEISATLHERRERWGISNVVVPWDCVDSFAPVVARLTGT